MGRGQGGCFSSNDAAAPSSVSTDKKPTTAQQPASGAAVVSSSTAAPKSGMANKKVYIIYYSMYGHVAKLAKAIKEGVDSVEGVEGVLYQVAETLPPEVLEKLHAPPKDPEIPVIDAHTLADADGFAFGFPTRFGAPAAQFKAFFDATGQHWQKQSLLGKPAGLFTSTATQGGGQEATFISALGNLAAHGIIYVPAGYAYGGPLYQVETARGGSPWGSGTLAGPDGSRQPNETELGAATLQGKRLAEVTKKLAA